MRSKRFEPLVMRAFRTVLVLGKADPVNQRGITPTTKWVVLCRECHRRCFIAKTKQIRAGTTTCECLVPTRTSFRQMIQRCTNNKHVHFDNYGGRGITISERWRHNFLNFLNDMGPRPEGKTLERRDTNAGYSAENCCGATPREQAQSRRPAKPRKRARMRKK